MSLASYATQISSFCRTGQLDPALEIDHKRIHVYFEHVRKKIKQALKRAFPLAYHLFTPSQWDEITGAFIAEQECTSPFFWMVPESFVKFIRKDEYANSFKIPYLDDLLDFEWIEIEMYRMADLSEPPCSKGEYSLNRESRILTYSYPVFEKKPLPRMMQKGLYSLLAFRHPTTKQVNFISLSPFFRVVLELLKEQPMSGQEVMSHVANAFKLDTQKALSSGEKFLKDLVEQGAIYEG